MDINQLLRSDTPESTTRLCFLLLVLSVIGWEWWALLHSSTVPRIEVILGFALTSLGWKQLQERKTKEIIGGDQNNTAQ